MAEKLLKYYKFVADNQGFQGQLKLAQMTLIAQPKAAMVPDSPDNLAKFRQAVEAITGKQAPVF